MGRPTKKQKVGNTGERIAGAFLLKKGYRILERNFRKPWGEIDIIAEKDGSVRFVEVKTVTREIRNGVTREIDYRPEELANRSKLIKVARTAALYMESKGDDREYQIDVVGVVVDDIRRLARCRLFEQALEDDL